MQGDWTVCVPLKYLIHVRLLPDIQEAKCSEFTFQTLPPPLLGAPRGGGQCKEFQKGKIQYKELIQITENFVK